MDTSEFLGLVAKLAVQGTGAEAGCVFVGRSDVVPLEIVAGWGVDADLLRQAQIVPGMGVLGTAYAEAIGFVSNGAASVRNGERIENVGLPARAILFEPMRAAEKSTGAVLVVKTRSSGGFLEEDVQYVRALATHAGVVLLNQELARDACLAEVDELTGLFNYRALCSRLQEEFERAKRYSRTLSVVMLEADDFAQVNNIHGHPVGNEALRKLAAVLRSSLRKSDFVARFGGDEFVLILPETDERQAAVLAERIRCAVEATEFPGGRTQPRGKLTVSLGVASFPKHARSEKHLLEFADKALYKGKAVGKNRACVYGEEPSVPAAPAGPPAEGAKVDALTGLVGSAAFREKLAEEIHEMGAEGKILSLIVVDVDHFQEYSRFNGVRTGDEALRRVGQVIRECAPGASVVARTANDQFAVVLPGVKKAVGLHTAERIGQRVKGVGFPGEKSLPLGKFTVSAGVASFPEDADNSEDLIMRAGLALVQAKHSGRSKVCAHPTTVTLV